MLRSKETITIIVLTLLVAALGAWALGPARGQLIVTFLDVGEGQCIVVMTPSGKTMVVDCGTSSWRDNTSVGTSTVLPYLRKNGIRRIDVALLTHPHQDHMSGYDGLLRGCPAGTFLDPGIESSADDYAELKEQLSSTNTRYRIAEAGQVIDLGDGVTAEILAPSKGVSASPGNEESIVVRITYGKTSFLLTGDTGEESENAILSSGADVRSEVLQVGHHGSSRATSSAWLSAVDPQVAVISVGKHNIYNHPSPDTLGRLEAQGARIYRTDEDGAVTCISDGTTTTLSAQVSH